jgi:hypothetical protein
MNYSLPITPLVNYAWRKSGLPMRSEHFDGEGFTQSLMAEMCQMDRSQLARYWRTGVIPWGTADKASVALGVLPHEIWGDEWFAMDAGLIEGTDAKAMRQVVASLKVVGDHLARMAA